MTRDEAVALMQLQLGFRSDQSANLILHLKLAQTMLEKSPTKPWFLIVGEDTLVTVADDQKIAIPTDFLQEAEQGVLRFIPDDADSPDDEVDLDKDSYDVLRKNFRTTASGEPQAYALFGGYFYIFPVPDDVYTLKMIRYGQDTVLSTNVENNWLKYAPKLLMGSAGKELAAALRDSNAMEIFARWESEDRILTFSQEIAREQANSDAQVGGPHV
jgi:hypothetical protein